MDPDRPPASFVTLPAELIHHVLTFLSLSDLLSVGLVNHKLYEHSLQDTLYQPFVQAHVPGTTLTKPLHSTWRELYISHHPFWFIPQRKIWFSDSAHTGKLLVARYDHRINAIEAYALVAERRQPTLQTWEWNPEAIIHTFSPRVRLDLNTPVVRLEPGAYQNATGEVGYRLQKEMPMNVFNPWPADITTAATPVWPPLILPSPGRTRNDSPSQFRDLNHRPSTLSELSTVTFRTRRWIEFAAAPQVHGVNVRVGEDISTWATLPEECYTPTPLKPWQGIWCGDYAGHGCEFLAILQPDDPDPLPQKAVWAIQSREWEREGSVSSTDSWNTAPMDLATEEEGPGHVDAVDAVHASPEPAGNTDENASTLAGAAHDGDIYSDPDCVAQDELIYRGRIEAIKLTGDPNVPRGEYTFIAPDIGPEGLVRVATEDMFKGARIVKCVGHIAAQGFIDDDFMNSQLILISPNRLAQYWEAFGHVSFYERVNIDELTKVS